MYILVILLIVFSNCHCLTIRKKGQAQLAYRGKDAGMVKEKMYSIPASVCSL